jgi:hypothetical protein
MVYVQTYIQVYKLITQYITEASHFPVYMTNTSLL